MSPLPTPRWHNLATSGPRFQVMRRKYSDGYRWCVVEEVSDGGEYTYGKYPDTISGQASAMEEAKKRNTGQKMTAEPLRPAPVMQGESRPGNNWAVTWVDPGENGGARIDYSGTYEKARAKADELKRNRATNVTVVRGPDR